MKCPHCGADNVDNSKFCVECGAGLDEGGKANLDIGGLKAKVKSEKGDGIDAMIREEDDLFDLDLNLDKNSKSSNKDDEDIFRELGLVEENDSGKDARKGKESGEISIQSNFLNEDSNFLNDVPSKEVPSKKASEPKKETTDSAEDDFFKELDLSDSQPSIDVKSESGDLKDDMSSSGEIKLDLLESSVQKPPSAQITDSKKSFDELFAGGDEEKYDELLPKKKEDSADNGFDFSLDSKPQPEAKAAKPSTSKDEGDLDIKMGDDAEFSLDDEGSDDDFSDLLPPKAEEGKKAEEMDFDLSGEDKEKGEFSFETEKFSLDEPAAESEEEPLFDASAVKTLFASPEEPKVKKPENADLKTEVPQSTVTPSKKTKIPPPAVSREESDLSRILPELTPEPEIPEIKSQIEPEISSDEAEPVIVESVPGGPAKGKEAVPVIERVRKKMQAEEEREREGEESQEEEIQVPEEEDEQKHLENLLFRLQQESNDDEKYAIIQELGEHKAENGVKPILDILNQDNLDLREAAIEALGDIGSGLATDPLLKMLVQEGNEDICYLLIKALGKIGSVQAVEHLLLVLNNENDDLVYVAAESLGKIGDERAVDGLIPLLKEKSGDLRFVAAKALGKIKSRKAIPALNKLADDPVDEVRSAVCEALGLLRAEESLDVLVSQLSDQNDDVKLKAVWALGEIRRREIVNSISILLKDLNERIRKEAAVALGKIGDPFSCESLIEALADVQDEVRLAACESLGLLKTPRAVAPLIKLLSENIAPELKQKAIIALGEIGDEEATETVIQHLDDKDERLREQSVIALGKIGNRMATEALIEVIDDANDEVRKQSVIALGVIKNEMAISRLIRKLSDENVVVSEEAVDALVKFKEQATEALVEFLPGSKSDIKSKVIRVFSRTGDIRTIMPLVRLLDSNDKKIKALTVDALLSIDRAVMESRKMILVMRESYSWLRFTIAQCLIREKDSRVSGMLVSILKDTIRAKDLEELRGLEDENIFCTVREVLNGMQRNVAELLGKFGNEQAVDQLIEVLSESESIAKYWAVFALGELGNSKAIEVLIGLLKHKTDGVDYYEIANALVKIGEQKIVRILLEELTVADDYAKESIIYTLGEFKDVRAIEPLVRSLKDSNEQLRKVAVEALGKIGSALAVEPLVKVLRDSNEKIRMTIIETLGALRDPRAVEPLTESLGDKSETIRIRIIESLGNIEDHRVVPIILKSINDQSDLVRAKAARILGEKKDRRALESLYKLLDDPDNRVREEAVEALGKIGDTGAITPLVKNLSLENMWIKNKIFEAISQFGEQAIPLLVKCLKNDDQVLRDNSTEILSMIQNNQLEKILIKMLYDRNRFMREHSALVLGNIKSVGSCDSLIELLSDRSKSVRGAVCKSLGRISDVRAIPPLKEALKDESREVREQAKLALNKIYEKNRI
ncbi:MAG: HEAT repeat domain-containing protein [Candidatus Wallbacteria bacterium]|nr:HEAT repeat domain-containing protein [Candidatus Wallbacteria bacterium]